MAVNLPPLDELDEKVKTNFPMKIVRKSIVKAIQELNRFPDFVSEFLISQFIDSEGNVAEDGLNEILADLQKYCPEKGEKEQTKSRVMELGNIDLIDHFQAYADLRKGKYFTQINSMDEKVSINRDLLQPGKFNDMLKSGLWGKASLQYIKKGDAASLNMNDFQSYQSTTAILKTYIRNRPNFSTEEWIDVLIRTIGFNPARFDRTQKLQYIARLIPLAEAQVNSLELGPPGTGKSYVYENLSEFARMLVGAEITPSKLIYNANNHQNGLIFQKDVICFDEVNKGHSSFLEIVPKLQQVMASGRVERGDLEATTDISLVFQGNIRFTTRRGQTVPLRDDYLEQELPVSMYDCAFLDRIQLFFHGWEFPVFDAEMINGNFGLISNYFGQILHKLRREDFSGIIRNRVKFFRVDVPSMHKPVSTRDLKALSYALTGYVKLIYPDKEVTDAELQEITQIVVHLRQNVIDQMVLIEPNQARTIGFEIIPSATANNVAGSPSVSSAASDPVSVQTNESAVPEQDDEEIMPEERVESDPNSSMSEELEVTSIESDQTNSSEAEATKEEERSDNENFVDLPAMPINSENFLTEKIPYWVMKCLVSNDQLSIEEGKLKLDKNERDFPQITQESPSLLPANVPVGTELEFNYEEQQIAEYVRKIDTLIEKLHRVIDASAQRKDFEYRAMRLRDNIRGLVLLKQLTNIIVNPDTTQINQCVAKLTTMKTLLEKMAGKSPDLLHPEYFCAVQPVDELIAELDPKIEYWHDVKNQIEDACKPVIREILKIEKETGSNEEILFNGQKFTLFTIDVNNMLKRYFDATKLHGNDALGLIMERYFPESPYMAFFFASKYHEHVQKSYPETDSIRWFIESMVKHDKSGNEYYADIDTLLTGTTTRFIAEHHDQISEIYLASGDKDLHIVADTAKKYSIPITVLAVSNDSLAHELYDLADSVDFLIST